MQEHICNYNCMAAVQVLPDQQLLLLIHCLQHQQQPIMDLYVLVQRLTFVRQLLQEQLIAGQDPVVLLLHQNSQYNKCNMLPMQEHTV